MSEVTPSRDMAEEGKRQTPDLEKDEADSTNACEEHKPTGLPVKVKHQSPDDGDSAENNMAPPTVKCPGDDKSRENSSLHGAAKECSGDHSRNEEQPAGAEATIGEGDSKDEKEEPETKTLLTGDGQDNQAHGQKTTNEKESSATNQTSAAAGEGEDDSEEGNKPPAATNSPNSGDRRDDQADGPIARNDKEPSATNTGDGEGKSLVEDDSKENSSVHGADKESHGENKRKEAQPAGDKATIDKEKASASEKVKVTSENTTSTETASQQNESLREESDHQEKDVETIGPTIQDTTEPGGIRKYLAAVCIVVFVAILVQHLLRPESPPQKKDVRQIDVFLKQMEKVKTGFPHQRAELWNRARIHLQRHLMTAQPTEPVSLILTAGLRAERTLHCLAQGLASAFSAALNASVLHIDGASKASEDSDQVKLDIDSKLQGAFEGDKPVAVIHRFEELPPGSTLIFYRYCDHENAAYKKTFLIFTVLLGEEEEIPAKIRLSAVEEMVDDHLQKKFLTHGHPVSFDRMDLDKYGGLWSRISHLILPVAAEERIEHEGC